MKNLAHTLLHILFSASLVCFLSWIPAGSYSQFMSTQALFEKGHRSYTTQNWVYASVYLYAYIQRAPDEFLDTNYKEEVIAAYNYSVIQLNKQSQEYKKLLGSKENRNKDSSVAQASDMKPPILRDPSQLPEDMQMKVIFDNLKTIQRSVFKKFN